MDKAYSVDLRERVVAAVVKGGMSCHEAAAKFSLAPSTAINWVRRKRETRSVAPSKIGGYRPKAIRDGQRDWLLRRIEEGDFTLRGLVAELAERGLAVDYKTVWNFVHNVKLSFKKSVVASERDRPDVARRRAQWMKYQGRIDPRCLVFLDETWTKTNMAPLHGWAPRGARLKAKVPHRQWKTTTFLAALAYDRIVAPWLIAGPIDGDSFQAYIERVLVATLNPGNIVIMDNLGSHKGKAVRRASARSAPSCSSSPNTRPTSIPSNRSSPSSSIAWVRPQPAHPMASPKASPTSCPPSPSRSVPTTLKTQDMLKPKAITL